jgi:hypothetical protein
VAVGPSGYEYEQVIDALQFDLFDPNDSDTVNAIREYLDLGWGWLDVFEVVEEFKDGNLGGEAGIGTLDHRDLEHVTDSDDHTQYYNQARGDARYYTKALADAATAAQISTAVAALTFANVAETATQKYFTSTLLSKLNGIEASATANATNAQLRDRATHTGTQSADSITDGTTNKAFTAAHKTKVDALTGAELATSTFTAHKAATSGTEHDARAITIPEVTNIDGQTFGLSATWVGPAIDWAGTTMQLDDWVVEVANGLYALDINVDVHKDSTQQHGMPAPGNRLIYRDADGMIPITLAANPPAEGEYPPVGTVWLYTDVGDKLTLVDHSGNFTVLNPAWINEFVALENDDAGSTTAVLRDGLTISSLDVGEYKLEAELYFTGPNGATGDVVVGFTGPTGASFDGTVHGIDPGDTGTDRIGPSIMRPVTIGSTCPAATQGTSNKVTVRITGYLRITTAGDFKIRYSQSVAEASAACILKANSWVAAVKVA